VELFVELFPAGVPWEPDAHEHDHADLRDHDDLRVHLEGGGHGPAVKVVGGRRWPVDRAAVELTTAELHDTVHEQRRRAV
jgi:hypothetical protein